MIAGDWEICLYFLHFLSIFVRFLLRLLPAYLVSSILNPGQNSQEISRQLYSLTDV